jgi:RimJ/RimL family protein N-acetyltransferase
MQPEEQNIKPDLPELADGEIALRPFELEDAEDHLAGDDDEQARWLGGKSTEESVRSWIQRNQEHWKNDGPIYNFAIIGTEGRIAGMVDANTDHTENDGVEEGDANVSYAIYPHARGKGYATKAIRLLEGFMAYKGVKRSVIRVPPENTASIGVPVRLGYEDEGSITSKDSDELRVFVKDLRN